MNKLLKISINTALFGLLISVFFSSCAPKINAVYFSDLDSLKVHEVDLPKFSEPLIQTDDILSITVQTIDPAASVAVNQTPAAASVSSTDYTGPLSGFLVDKKGEVEIPMLGVIKLAGLTTYEAKEKIRKVAAVYYTNPTIQVRFANYKITVLGEVVKPSSYNVPTEKVTVLDALALAGDLTIYGKRENVLLIRDAGGKKEVVRLDLTSAALLSSPYFYLKQNDVLYVEPSKGKVAANNVQRRQNFTVIFSGIALIIAILTKF